MSKRNLVDIFDEIDTDLIEDAANIKNQIPYNTVNEGKSLKNSKSENTVTEVYKIEAETHTRKNYIKYAVSAAAVLFIAGLAGITASLNLSQDKDNNSVAEVSQTITSSADTDRAETEVVSSVSETAAKTVTGSESVSTASEIITNKAILSETVTSISEVISEPDDKSSGEHTEKKPAEESTPAPKDNASRPVTEKTVITEIVIQTESQKPVITDSVKQTEPEKTAEELPSETDTPQIHLPCMPAVGPDSGYPDGSITPEGFAEALGSLSYSPETCDGLPLYEFTAPDGTEYYILDEYIWRKNTETGQMEEAERTESVDYWIMAYIGLYVLIYD